MTTWLHPDPTTVGSGNASGSPSPEPADALLSSAACSVTVAPAGGVKANSAASGVLKSTDVKPTS